MLSVLPFAIVVVLFLKKITFAEPTPPSSPQPPPSNLIPTLLQLNSGWTQLPFNVNQSNWVPNVYRLASPVPVRFQFTDTFCPGERVSVYINGTFFANSTDVPFPPQLLCYPGMALPEGTVAFSDIYSRLDVELPAGEHEISFMLTRSNPVFQRGLMYARAFIELESKCSSSDGN